ncbi:MAG: ATP-binding cassette domain-containing protein [Evtepia sp.]
MQPTNRPVNAVELRDVTKTFGKVVANDHVSLDIRKGEILSLLGENGSGKTTLMNMLAGIYFPDERTDPGGRQASLHPLPEGRLRPAASA